MDRLDVRQGTLWLMVLKTLDVLGPLHGYGIARRIEETSRNRLVLNYGTLYPALVKLEQEGFITSLAEPNLTAMSGQTASFLAGGEFPVPISGSSASTNGFPTITVEFKSFGVSLAFTPTVIDANHLNLRVRPEVSGTDT